MKRIFVLILILLIALAAGIYVKSYTSKDTKNLGKEVFQEIKSYHYIEPGQVTCDAIVPECGHCPGRIIDKKCYKKEN